jgi:hypothetical protein
METTTAFDLNQAIQRWRDNLAQSPAFRSENLYELETHLRDSIAVLQRQGLSVEESYLVGVRRLGKTGSLEAEFAKQNGQSIWLDRALWILIGAQIWSLAGNLTNYLQVLLNIALPKVNEWLTTYGFGAIPESIPAQVFYVVALPVTILIGAKAFATFHRWAEGRGWSPLAFFLNRPRLLAASYAILFVMPMVFSWGMGALVAKYGLQRHFSTPGLSGYTLVALLVLHTTVFAAIVMIIARRRLKLNRS